MMKVCSDILQGGASGRWVQTSEINVRSGPLSHTCDTQFCADIKPEALLFTVTLSWPALVTRDAGIPGTGGSRL